MKGLLLKDLYMMRHYCKIYLLVAVVFLAVSLISGGTMFFVFYPCLLCGMIPVNLLGYDEKSHFLQYGATLPYTKGQIVSAKYLLGLFTQIIVIAATGIVQGIKMATDGNFAGVDFTALILSVLCVSTLTPAISLPFLFKYGMEKGRIAYYVMIGFVCAAGFLFSDLFQNTPKTSVAPWFVLAGLSVVCIGIYLLSWYVSVVFYRKREL